MEIVSLTEASNTQVAEWLVDLADDLRPSDLDEIAATNGLDPATALVASVMVSSHAWVILDRGDPICAFGVAPDAHRFSDGIIWMVGSPRMDEPRNALGILRRSREYLEVIHGAYPEVANWVDARNVKSMRWLSWCGFEIDDSDPVYGPERRLFFHFRRRAADV